MKKLISLLLCFFIACPVNVIQAQNISGSTLPAINSVNPITAFEPFTLKGLTLDPNNPFKFEFLADIGQSGLSNEEATIESQRLIRYFFAALTIPKGDIWVNLSPYEKNRIIPNTLEQTELGRDMLEQDYVLKQITSNLMNPNTELGAEFWDKIHKTIYSKFGNMDIPADILNKVWIIPEKATIYADGLTAYVVSGHLKVMLEEDYQNNSKTNPNDIESVGPQHAVAENERTRHAVSLQIIKEIILPAIEKEVNEGADFSTIRQIFYSLILAKWYKQTVLDGILSKLYFNQNKIKGIDTVDKSMTENVYNQYLEKFKNGVFETIKEEYDPITQQLIPRKYVSGGISKAMDFALLNSSQKPSLSQKFLKLNVTAQPGGDPAMTASISETEINRIVKQFVLLKRELKIPSVFVRIKTKYELPNIPGSKTFLALLQMKLKEEEGLEFTQNTLEAILETQSIFPTNENKTSHLNQTQFGISGQMPGVIRTARIKIYNQQRYEFPTQNQQEPLQEIPDTKQEIRTALWKSALNVFLGDSERLETTLREIKDTFEILEYLKKLKQSSPLSEEQQKIEKYLENKYRTGEFFYRSQRDAIKNVFTDANTIFSNLITDPDWMKFYNDSTFTYQSSWSRSTISLYAEERLQMLSSFPESHFIVKSMKELVFRFLEAQSQLGIRSKVTSADMEIQKFANALKKTKHDFIVLHNSPTITMSESPDQWDRTLKETLNAPEKDITLEHLPADIKSIFQGEQNLPNFVTTAVQQRHISAFDAIAEYMAIHFAEKPPTTTQYRFIGLLATTVSVEKDPTPVVFLTDSKTLIEDAILFKQHAAQSNFRGLVTYLGGPTSHCCIYARDVDGIDVTGVKLDNIEDLDGKRIILRSRGKNGSGKAEVIIDPDIETLADALIEQELGEQKMEYYRYLAHTNIVKFDGYTPPAAVDVENKDSMRHAFAVELAHMIGLLRGESIFTSDEFLNKNKAMRKKIIEYIKLIQEQELTLTKIIPDENKNDLGKLTLRIYDFQADKINALREFIQKTRPNLPRGQIEEILYNLKNDRFAGMNFYFYKDALIGDLFYKLGVQQIKEALLAAKETDYNKLILSFPNVRFSENFQISDLIQMIREGLLEAARETNADNIIATAQNLLSRVSFSAYLEDKILSQADIDKIFAEPHNIVIEDDGQSKKLPLSFESASIGMNDFTMSVYPDLKRNTANEKNNDLTGELLYELHKLILYSKQHPVPIFISGDLGKSARVAILAQILSVHYKIPIYTTSNPYTISRQRAFLWFISMHHKMYKQFTDILIPLFDVFNDPDINELQKVNRAEAALNQFNTLDREVFAAIEQERLALEETLDTLRAEINKDAAMATNIAPEEVGGIDLNNIDIEQTGTTDINWNFDQTQLQELLTDGIDSLTPIITEVTPVQNISPLRNSSSRF